VGSAWTQPGYDAAGNMTTMPQPNVPGSQYTGIFDAWQRLVKLVDPSTGNVVQVNQYDGRNFRVVRETYSSGTLSETRQFYHSTSWRVLEERVGAAPNTAVLDRQYTWGLRYIDDLVLRDRTTESGTLAERLYALQDANWNMVALYNATSSEVVERYAYSAYGVCSFLDAGFNALSGSSYDWTVLYTGRELDAATGLYYYRMRYYLALLGVFVNRDPIGLKGGVNRSAYAQGCPTTFQDPYGLKIAVEGISPDSELTEIADNEAFFASVLVYLQRIIGDCAKLKYLNEEKLTRLNIHHYSEIAFSDEKANCACNECWQLLKRAIEHERTIFIHREHYKGWPQLGGYYPNATTTRSRYFYLGDPDADVGLDVQIQVVLWEIDPTTGGGINTLQRPDIILWHEVLGHGLPIIENRRIPTEFSHPNEILMPDGKKVRNWYEPGTSGSGAYDAAIKVENLGRACLRKQHINVRDRVHRYYGYHDVDPKTGKETDAPIGATRPYSGE
jgi:RHS repeat-associated protein